MDQEVEVEGIVAQPIEVIRGSITEPEKFHWLGIPTHL